MIAVSFGGGVQSTALAHMVLTDDPRIRSFGRPGLWVFADTGDEPRRVYAHVEEWGNRIADGGMEFVVVTAPKLGRLSEHVLSGSRAGRVSTKLPPFFVAGDDGRLGPINRQCTEEWKILPVRRSLRARGAHRRAPWPVWLGISRDEAHRSRISRVQYLTHVYPLIDLNLRRTDCLQMLAGAGIEAPRSACTFCPFRSNEEWRSLRDTSPEDWSDAVAFEAACHAEHDEGRMGSLRRRPYLHRSGLPIDEAPIDTDQESFGWGNECAGMCGV